MHGHVHFFSLSRRKIRTMIINVQCRGTNHTITFEMSAESSGFENSCRCKSFTTPTHPPIHLYHLINTCMMTQVHLFPQITSVPPFAFPSGRNPLAHTYYWHTHNCGIHTPPKGTAVPLLLSHLVYAAEQKEGSKSHHKLLNRPKQKSDPRKRRQSAQPTSNKNITQILPAAAALVAALSHHRPHSFH